MSPAKRFNMRERASSSRSHAGSARAGMSFAAERYFERRRSTERVEFETALREEGYLEVADRRMELNKTNPEHSHEFDARLLILEGEITITSEGQERT
jgi:hypothetical protein